MTIMEAEERIFRDVARLRKVSSGRRLVAERISSAIPEGVTVKFSPFALPGSSTTWPGGSGPFLLKNEITSFYNLFARS